MTGNAEANEQCQDERERAMKNSFKSKKKVAEEQGREKISPCGASLTSRDGPGAGWATVFVRAKANMFANETHLRGKK